MLFLQQQSLLFFEDVPAVNNDFIWETILLIKPL
jgi:hypothetical protein